MGPDALVVRGFDPNQMRRELSALDANPPALVVTDQVPDNDEESSHGRIIELELSRQFASDQFSIVPWLKRLVEALKNPEAMSQLESSDVQSGKLRRFWGWIAEYTELKPTFMGFGINMNAIIRDWADADRRRQQHSRHAGADSMTRPCSHARVAHIS